MQRSIPNQRSLKPFVLVGLFFIYTALSGIYLFLPPLLAILFFLFSKALKEENSSMLFLVSFCLVVFEAQNSYVLFSSIIYFSLLYRYVMPKIKQNFNCISCIRFAKIVLVYTGFFLFNSIFSSIFLLPEPSISYHVIYYMVVEFLILSLM